MKQYLKLFTMFLKIENSVYVIGMKAGKFAFSELHAYVNELYSYLTIKVLNL